jgi:hypothetical protein
MVDDIFDASRPRGRVEILTGVGRRRRWSEEEKGRIVVESYTASAVVSEVARRYEISPQHPFGPPCAGEASCEYRLVDSPLRVVSQPSRPITARPVAKSGRAEGRGTGETAISGANVNPYAAIPSGTPYSK